MVDVRPILREVEARVIDALAPLGAVRQERGLFYVPNVGAPAEDIDGHIGVNDLPYPNGACDLSIYVGVRANEIERLIAPYVNVEREYRHLPSTFVRNYGYFGPERVYTTHSLPPGFDFDRVGRIMKKVLAVTEKLWPTLDTVAKIVQALEIVPGPFLTRASRIAAGYYLLNDRLALRRTVERGFAEKDQTPLGDEFRQLAHRLLA